jgi:hypothetical protein
VRDYLGVARECGIAEEKIEAVRSVVMAISACSIANRAEIDSVLPEEQQKAFSRFYELSEKNQALGTRTTRLVQLAAALVNGCPT